MKKTGKLFGLAALLLTACIGLTACDLFGPGEPDEPSDYSPDAGEYRYYSGFSIKTPGYLEDTSYYETYTSDSLDDIFADYELLLLEAVPKLDAVWLEPPFTGVNQLQNNSVQWRLDYIYRLVAGFADQGALTQPTLVLTVDEPAGDETETQPATGSGTVGFRTGSYTSEYLWLYQEVAYTYNAAGGMTITDTSADAAELKLDGFLKFSYVDDSVTMTFDVSGYLKGATADNLTSGERARIPVLVLAMDFS